MILTPQKPAVIQQKKPIIQISKKSRVVPRPLTELAPETAKLIEDVTVDRRGRLIPRLYSKMAASKELRSMLNLSARADAADVTRAIRNRSRPWLNKPANSVFPLIKIIHFISRKRLTN